MIKRIYSPEAPKPAGPYSQGIEASGFLFVSAQLGVDPATGVMADGVDAQASRALENVLEVLRAGGSGWSSVVKVTLYLVDMSTFARVNEIYSSKLGGAAPARSTVGVSTLPRGGLVAADAVAVVS